MVTTRQVGDKLFLDDQRSGMSLALNPMGSAIWMDLSTPKSINDLTTILQELYPNEPQEKLKQGVTGYLRQLQAQDVVVSS